MIVELSVIVFGASVHVVVSVIGVVTCMERLVVRRLVLQELTVAVEVTVAAGRVSVLV